MSEILKYIGFLKSKFIYEWNFIKRRRSRSFYSQFINEGDLCFDVGAHLGDRSETWLKIGANVVAIDPQPKFYNYLKNKFSNNSNIYLENLALTDSEGTAKMHISHLHPTVSSLSNENWRKNLIEASTMKVEYNETIEVKTNSIDFLIKKYGTPTFIKIDVEGFEIEVLNGLTQPVDYISFEFLSFDINGLEACLDYLIDLGYEKFNWSYAETFKFDNQGWLDKADLMDKINGFRKESFSGDVYAKLK